MSIRYAPKVGELLQCNYGMTGQDVNGHLPPEMIKNRLVIVLNAKLSNACIVVPLSATFDREKTRRGWHVALAASMIPAIGNHFRPVPRWAKSDLVQQVSKQRLSKLDPHNLPNGFCLDRTTTAAIQTAVIRAISATSLLKT